MKEILIATSGVTGQQLNATEYTYFITFPRVAGYSYMIKATQEGFNNMVLLWKEAGYSIKFTDTEPG